MRAEPPPPALHPPVGNSLQKSRIHAAFMQFQRHGRGIYAVSLRPEVMRQWLLRPEVMRQWLLRPEVMRQWLLRPEVMRQWLLRAVCRLAALAL